MRLSFAPELRQPGFDRQLLRLLVISQFIVISFAVLSTENWMAASPIKEVLLVVSTCIMIPLGLWSFLGDGSHRCMLRGFDVTLLILLVWVIVSGVAFRYRWMAVAPVVIALCLASVFFIVRLAFRSIRRLQQIFLIACLATGVVALLGIFEYPEFWPNANYLLRRHSTGRIHSTMGNPNLLGAFLNTGFFASLGLLMSGIPGTKRMIVAVSMAATAAALVLTESRGALLGFAVACGVYVLLYNLWSVVSTLHRRIRTILLAALSVVVLGAGVLVVRAGSLNLSALAVDEPRRVMWNGSVRMIAERPLVGCGVGRFGVAYLLTGTSRLGDGTAMGVEHAHCEPLEFAAELGVVGLLLALIFLDRLITFVQAAAPSTGAVISSRPALACGGLAGACAVLAQSFVCVPSRFVQTSYPMCLFVGLSVASIAPSSSPGRAIRYVLSKRLSRVLRLTLVCVSGAVVLTSAVIGWRVCAACARSMEGQTHAAYAHAHGESQHIYLPVAVAHLGEAVALNPYSAESWYLLGSYYGILGMKTESMAAFRKVSEICPHFADVDRHLAAGRI